MADKKNGIIVFYVNVGLLSPDKAESYMNEFEENLEQKGFLDKMVESGYEPLFIPNRESTRVEFLKF